MVNDDGKNVVISLPFPFPHLIGDNKNPLVGQPTWKISSSNWIIFPGIGVNNSKNIWVATTYSPRKPPLVGCQHSIAHSRWNAPELRMPGISESSVTKKMRVVKLRMISMGVLNNPPEGNIQVVYKCYILPIGGLYATYHLLREPKTTIDDFSTKIPKQQTMEMKLKLVKGWWRWT